MTNEQLAWNVQNGNRAALTELWGAVRPLLFSLAWKFYSRQGKERCSSHGVTLEDLQQEAFFALYDAVRAFDEGKGYQFTTYLSRATENRFRACMGIRGKRDPLNAADRLERPLPGEEERQQGDTIPDEQAQAALEAVGRCSPTGTAPGGVGGKPWRPCQPHKGTCCGCGLPAERHGQRQPRPWVSAPRRCAKRNSGPCSFSGGSLLFWR